MLKTDYEDAASVETSKGTYPSWQLGKELALSIDSWKALCLISKQVLINPLWLSSSLQMLYIKALGYILLPFEKEES